MKQSWRKLKSLVSNLFGRLSSPPPAPITEAEEPKELFPFVGLEIAPVDWMPGDITTIHSAVEHVRRPISCFFDVAIDPRPYMLFDCLYIYIGDECPTPLTFEANISGFPEAVMISRSIVRPLERVMLLGVHDFPAEAGLRLTITSTSPFSINGVDPRFKRPPFRREDGMIIYNDPRYPSHPESFNPGAGSDPVHHRKVFGPGKDVGFSG